MTVKIAHISEVHWERRDQFVSDCLTRALRRESPHILVFTGDLVDNPWRLKKAKLWLLDLCDACKIKSSTHLVIVPGNHDYRLWGVLNIKPLTGVLFRRRFRDWLGRRIVPFPDLGVSFLRIDSNPVAIGFARGRAGRWELRKLARELANLSQPEREQFSRSVKIALLHHHPLPVPYEGGDTFLMLEDAQRLIQFLAEKRIEMILHGHKHRAPYSLICLGTCGTSERAFEVLGAGAAVIQGVDRDPRGHNFNLICIEESGLRYVRQFFARPGEEFVEVLPSGFPTHSFELAYQRALARAAYKYGKAHWDLDINVEGDRFNEITYSGVTAVGGRELLSVTPPAYGVESGHLSGVWLEESKTSPGVSIDVLKHEPRSVEFRVNFSTTPTDAAPAQFRVQSYDLNASSLDLSEFRRKFPTQKLNREHEEKEISEPVEDLSWTLRFPPEMKFEYPPGFEVVDGSSGVRHEWLTRVLQSSFYYSEALHTAFVSIHKPPANYLYRIYWYIPTGTEARPSDPKHKIVAEQFSRRLLTLHAAAGAGGAPPPELSEVVGILDTFAHLVARRIEGEIKQSGLVDIEELEVSLMVYDDTRGGEVPKLRIVAFRGPKSREFWDFSLEVGDGIAGRAYKKNIVRSFDAKSLDGKEQSYVAFPGYPIHQMLYSMPLRHPLCQELIFAILNLGAFSLKEAGLLRLVNDDDGIRWLLEHAHGYLLRRLLGWSKAEGCYGERSFTAIKMLAKVLLGSGGTGYRFKVVRQPDDEKIYNAGLELERALAQEALKQKDQEPQGPLLSKS